MDEATRKRLRASLDAYDRRRKVGQKTADALAQQLAVFLDGFLRFRDATIEPMMREFAQELTARGHNCTVKKDDPTPDEEVRQAGIELWIVPGGWSARTTRLASIRFYASDDHVTEQVIKTQVNAKTSSGPTASIPLGDGAEARVRELLLAGVAKVLEA